jgi:hypothetical protein
VVVVVYVIAGDSKCVVTVNYSFVRMVYDFCVYVLDVAAIHSIERKTVEDQTGKRVRL